MKRYKLLNPDRTTHNDTHWPIGQWVETKGDPNQGLCSDGWLHCYDSPELALFLNPIHANISDPIVCEVETRGKSLNDKGLKRGYRKMRIVRDLGIKQPTIGQCVRFAILCAKQVYKDTDWNLWADKWLSGEDRTNAAAHVAADAVYNAVDAANAAADAVYNAVDAADAANAAAHAAVYNAVDAAAYNAVDAAYAAAYAAADAAANTPINLVEIAKQAMKEEL